MGKRTDADGREVLKDLEHVLGGDATSFTPAREQGSGALPGRRPGTNLYHHETPTQGPAAVLLDIGTSRTSGFTHVLWVSASAATQLGEDAAARLGELMETIDGVKGFEWEGESHLHLAAPDLAHADLLREARVLVAQLLA